MGDRAWRQRAACRGLNPNLFHPTRGDDHRLAVAVCRTCPVSAECLDYALANGELHGIWGGMTERQRGPLRRQHRLSVV